MTPSAFAACYADLGWAVLLVGSDKRPLIKNWPLDATIDIDQIGQWWERWPLVQCAIVTGTRSGVVALDIDVWSDYSGFSILEKLGISDTHDTPTAHTSSGGLHFLFGQPCREIEQAPHGQQEKNLSTQAFKVGSLAGRQGSPPEECLPSLIAAGCKLKSFDQQRPWRPDEVKGKVERSFFAGSRKPGSTR
jgi:hypothetical protein